MFRSGSSIYTSIGSGLSDLQFPGREVDAANPTFDIDLGPSFPGLCAAADPTYADSANGRTTESTCMP